MGIIDLAQARTSLGLKNASIGISPPEISLSRLARPKEASLRPAKILRRCHSEHSAAAASSPTDLPLSPAQRSMGCSSDMAAIIPPRNDKSQDEIFLGEIVSGSIDFVNCGMAKRREIEPREIYLGDWLKEWNIGPSEAAKIAGCTQGYISNISRGARPNVNAVYLLNLSEHMGVNVNDFFRPLPSQSQLAPLKNLSPKAQAAILGRTQKKA